MNPDTAILQRELAMLKYRASAAELSLYQLADQLRSMSKHADDVVRKVHELNRQFPLGDASKDELTRLTINAVKASMPEAAGLSDDEVVKRYLTPIKPDEVAP